MKPITIQKGREMIFFFSRPQSLYSTGRQLQIIYETLAGKIESQSFDWPWRVDISARNVDEIF